jgi:hypothetical protein
VIEGEINASPAWAARTASTSSASAGAWIISEQTVSASGRSVSAPTTLIERCLGSARGQVSASCFARVSALGYRVRVTYQPGGRFWSPQLWETAIFLALALLLSGLCAW